MLSNNELVYRHSLMGNVGDFLWIDKDTGDIFVLQNDTFDYHRQNVYFIQVKLASFDSRYPLIAKYSRTLVNVL